MELAKFEAFLKNQNVLHIKANVRGRQRLAYPIKRWDRKGSAALHSTTHCAESTSGPGKCTIWLELGVWATSS